MEEYKKKKSKGLLVGGIVLSFLFIYMLAENSNLAASNAAVEISVQKANELILKNSGGNELVILDIRTPQEFSQGHIKGALNINFFAPDYKKRLSELDKNKTYLFHCKSGGRSGRSVNIFKELKFEKIIHMNGGFDEWLKFRLPVEKP